MSDSVIYTLLIAGLISMLGFAGDRMFQKTGIPDVLLLLLVGGLIGPVLGLIQPEQLAEITPYFGTLVLIFILFDGGLELDFDLILKQFLPVIVLVVMSMLTVIGSVASIAMYFYDWPWLPSLLLGTILANTSGAIVLPVVSRLAISEQDKSILKLEAAASDVLVILLFVTFMSILEAMGASGTSINAISVDARETLSKLAGSFCIAIVIGTLVGVAWMLVLNRIYRIQHNYMATLGMMLTLYSVSEYLNASGMMSVLFFGIVLANSSKFGYFFNIKEIHYSSRGMKHLHTTFSFLLRTFFLIYIGFFMSKEMLQPAFLKTGFTIVAALVIARILNGLFFAWVFKKNRTTLIAVISMMPRGLAVAALATVPSQSIIQSTSIHAEAVVQEESHIAGLRSELTSIRERKLKAQDEKQLEMYDELTRKEIELSAQVAMAKIVLSDHDRVVNRLSSMRASTGSFILYAPLAILVTNILMSFGCLAIKGKSAAGDAAEDQTLAGGSFDDPAFKKINPNDTWMMTDEEMVRLREVQRRRKKQERHVAPEPPPESGNDHTET